MPRRSRKVAQVPVWLCVASVAVTAVLCSLFHSVEHLEAYPWNSDASEKRANSTHTADAKSLSGRLRPASDGSVSEAPLELQDLTLPGHAHDRIDGTSTDLKKPLPGVIPPNKNDESDHSWAHVEPSAAGLRTSTDLKKPQTGRVPPHRNDESDLSWARVGFSAAKLRGDRSDGASTDLKKPRGPPKRKDESDHSWAHVESSAAGLRHDRSGGTSDLSKSPLAGAPLQDVTDMDYEHMSVLREERLSRRERTKITRGASQSKPVCSGPAGQGNCKLAPTPSIRGDLQCCCHRGQTKVWTCFPYFFIIGAQKAGTTALLAYMLQSKHVLTPRGKETHFFDRGSGDKAMTSLSRWPANPDPATHVAVDATPSYVLNPETSQFISQALPQAKAILIVREPVDRAWSEYQMVVRRGAMWQALLDSIEPRAAEIRNCSLSLGHSSRRPSFVDCLYHKEKKRRTNQHTFEMRLPGFLRRTFKGGADVTNIFVYDDEGVHLNRTTMTPLGLRTPFHVKVRSELRMLRPCVETVGEGKEQTATLRVQGSCVSWGLSSNIELGGHVYRSLYSYQVEEWLKSFSATQLHVVSHSRLSNDGLRSVEGVCKFLGLPSFLDGRAMTSKELDDVIQTKFPTFKDEGWLIDGVASYEQLSGPLRREMHQFFAPFRRKFEEILRSSLGWSAEDAANPF